MPKKKKPVEKKEKPIKQEKFPPLYEVTIYGAHPDSVDCEYIYADDFEVEAETKIAYFYIDTEEAFDKKLIAAFKEWKVIRVLAPDVAAERMMTKVENEAKKLKSSCSIFEPPGKYNG